MLLNVFILIVAVLFTLGVIVKIWTEVIPNAITMIRVMRKSHRLPTSKITVAVDIIMGAVYLIGVLVGWAIVLAAIGWMIAKFAIPFISSLLYV